jgi:hypothetical protein
MNKDMEFYNVEDILDLFTWTIFEDCSLFNGANTATVRQHSKQWAATAAAWRRWRGPPREISSVSFLCASRCGRIEVCRLRCSAAGRRRRVQEGLGKADQQILDAAQREPQL